MISIANKKERDKFFLSQGAICFIEWLTGETNYICRILMKIAKIAAKFLKFIEKKIYKFGIHLEKQILKEKIL